MEQYLIDTNVISDYFSASLPASGLEFMDAVINETPNVSVITQIELLCWKTETVKEQMVNDFVGDSVIFNISPDVIAQCVKIRRNKKIKTPDAIIAATAIAHGFTLITNNEKDFTNIPGLEIVNPFRL
ncbi:MAG: type II toxin-antitoxin system VapC family toxin [Tannerella sp.]|jgi:predicted nucleic acid-binding protein|nr:type II toxin-antitoxin system VapC family toxin [Tannerella sp.]